MKNIILLSLLALSLWLTAQESHIQIIAESGISVYMDGKLQGITTTDYDGLIIQNVKIGEHNLKLTKSGYNPVEENINVKANEVFVYKVSMGSKKINISQDGDDGNKTLKQKSGILEIRSIPTNISIKIEDLGIESAKNQDSWKAENVPIGNFEIKLFYKSQVIVELVEIKSDSITSLFVDFPNKTVVNSIKYADSIGSYDRYIEANIKTNNYMLGTRKALTKPIPIYDCMDEGRVVVKVVVSRSGKTESAESGVEIPNGIKSTTASSCLLNRAKQAALRTTWQGDASADDYQVGYIVYTFTKQ